jgi:hypothetical protein
MYTYTIILSPKTGTHSYKSVLQFEYMLRIHAYIQQVRFSNDEKQIVLDVLAGKSDVGFVKTVGYMYVCIYVCMQVY